MNNEYLSFIKDYSKAILSGKASLFIGSGISRPANYVGWKEILRECAEEINLNVDREEKNLITLAEYYVKSKQRTKITSAIRDFFADANGCPTKTHDLIATLPIRNIWTTNYDRLLERIYTSHNIPYTVLTDDISYQNINPDAKVTIHKIHGDVLAPDKCIITRGEYEEFEKTHDIVLSELKGEMCSNSFLFLGYGFNDTDIQHILSKIRLIFSANNQPQRHYCIIEEVNIKDYETEQDYLYEKNKQEHHINDMQSYGINVVLVKSYNEIENILSAINDVVLLKNVTISGAYEKGYTYENRSSETALKISRELIKAGFNIYTGFGKNLGGDIVTGAFDGCTKVSKATEFKERVHLFPMPYKKQPSEEQRSLHTKIRKNFISKTRTTIIIAGKKKSNGSEINSEGTLEEALLSIEQGNLIIPIPTTGGTALFVYDKIIELNPPYSQQEDFRSLKGEVSPSKIAELVLRIIKNYINERK